MGDMREVIRAAGDSLRGVATSVKINGVDMTPYLSAHLHFQYAPKKPATAVDILLQRSKARVEQRLGKVTHSWRDR